MDIIGFRDFKKLNYFKIYRSPVILEHLVLFSVGSPESSVCSGFTRDLLFLYIGASHPNINIALKSLENQGFISGSPKEFIPGTMQGLRPIGYLSTDTGYTAAEAFRNGVLAHYGPNSPEAKIIENLRTKGTTYDS